MNKKDYLSMSSNSNNISSTSKNKIKVKDVLIGLNPNGYVQLLLKNLKVTELSCLACMVASDLEDGENLNIA